MKAILGDANVQRRGQWSVPKREDIGYLDQHYKNLDVTKRVIDHIPYTIYLRKHLNDFLFRKNEEVYALVSRLSGGEKVRLSLAQIASQTPRLLILDEVTNNLDLETQEHVNPSAARLSLNPYHHFTRRGFFSTCENQYPLFFMTSRLAPFEILFLAFFDDHDD